VWDWALIIFNVAFYTTVVLIHVGVL